MTKIQTAVITFSSLDVLAMSRSAAAILEPHKLTRSSPRGRDGTLYLDLCRVSVKDVLLTVIGMNTVTGAKCWALLKTLL